MTKQPIITRTEALRDPSAHRLVLGGGYRRLGAPRRRGPFPQAAALLPAPAAATGSQHHLTSPQGVTLQFEWQAAPRSWLRQGGHRLGFAPEYLAEHGWAYAGPA